MKRLTNIDKSKTDELTADESKLYQLTNNHNLTVREIAMADVKVIHELGNEHGEKVNWDIEYYIKVIAGCPTPIRFPDDKVFKKCVVDISCNLIVAMLFAWNNYGVPIIANVAVKTGYRRQGLATYLFESFAREIIMTKHPTVTISAYSNNTPALDMYHNLGFVDTRAIKTVQGPDIKSQYMEIPTTKFATNTDRALKKKIEYHDYRRTLLCFGYIRRLERGRELAISEDVKAMVTLSYKCRIKT